MIGPSLSSGGVRGALVGCEDFIGRARIVGNAVVRGPGMNLNLAWNGKTAKAESEALRVVTYPRD